MFRDLVFKVKDLVNPFADRAESSAPDIRQRMYDTLFTKEFASHGSWGALLVLAVAGLVKFHKQLKLPIAIDLKKYLSTPDYEGHAAFIESFHEDFARLVHAYAGSERVFIFIDDLDRCDVPRAAELMQAINLMIGDAGHLVFIIGMDRGKVAAGITQKYKDLLPFLVEYSADGGPDLGQGLGRRSNPLAFGYSYLEKFIQLSFTLPVIAGADGLERFLDGLLPSLPSLTWLDQFKSYWGQRLRKIIGKSGSPDDPEAADEMRPSEESPSMRVGPISTNIADTARIDAEARIRKIRIKIAEDSNGVRSIVSMVSPMFENNPRRLKQFVSTLRLALALSSDQGILGLDAAQSTVTPQQIGKFVALTMKFPDLRVALSEDPKLLDAVQEQARIWERLNDSSRYYWRWLHQKSVRSVILYGVREMDPLSDQTDEPNPFSLIGLNIGRLMSLLPKVPPPEPQHSEAPSPARTTSEILSNAPPLATGQDLRRQFNDFAFEYEQVRASQPPSSKRTHDMTKVVESIQAAIREFSPATARDILAEQLARNTDGSRIVTLSIFCERPSQENVERLLDYLAEYRSNFEHFWTIRALLLHKQYFGETEARAINDTLNRLMPEIVKDQGRSGSAEALKVIVEPISTPPQA